MSEFQCKTPVVLIIFKRPTETEYVLNAIRQVKPAQLFVIADGPRPDRPGEAEQCAATRAIIDRVDWDCEVHRNYSEVNLGCGPRPATGISWVFEQVDRAIILEDDCLPDPSFFLFCEELLEKYKDDPRVMHIGGSTYGIKSKSNSYFFSNFCSCWGWATWRRAWSHFDFEMSRFPQVAKTTWLETLLEDRWIGRYWQRNFQNTYSSEGKQHIWDYQWQFACWLHQGLSIRSNSNLISNIGSGTAATHTFDEHDPNIARRLEPMVFPLQHPEAVVRDRQADRAIVNLMRNDYLRKRSLIPRAGNKLNRLLKQLSFAH